MMDIVPTDDMAQQTPAVANPSAPKKFRGRPKGSKSHVNNKTPGVSKLGEYKVLPPSMIHDLKVKILGMLESGEAETLTEAADKLGVSAVKVHDWTSRDKNFKDMLNLVDEVIADRIEKELYHHANFIPKMFVLKAKRPEYNEKFRLDVTNPRLEDLLSELNKAKPEPPKVENTPTVLGLPIATESK